MNDNTDTVIGLTPAVRETFTAAHIANVVGRTLSGDPGDGHDDDLNLVMEIVSSDMDNRASHRIFRTEDPKDVLHCFFRPAEHHLLVTTEKDVHDEDVKPGIRAFGFDPETLKPIGE